MGRVIKKDEQSDVTSASLDAKELRDEGGAPSSSRIPAEKVEPPSDADRPAGKGASEGQVLRGEETQQAVQPVSVEPVTPAEDPDSDDAPSSVRDADGGHDGGAADDRKEEAEKADGPPTRTDAEWQEHLEEEVEAARAEGYEAGREEGYDAGYEEGYDEAEATLRAEWEAEREALIEDITRFDEVWAEYIDESESRFVELALQLAEAIVDAPIASSLRQASEEALAEAVAKLSGTPPVTITVHPVDFQRLQESGLAEHLTDKYEDLHLESDPECAEGDWSVASPSGVVRRRRQEVVNTLRDHLSLSSASVVDEE